MSISSININTQSNPSFGHSNPWADSPYNKKDRMIVAGTTALGVTTSMALLAKHHKYKISNPFKNLKNDNYPLFSKKQFKHMFSELYGKYKSSWFNKVEYDEAPVIAIGAGSCLGGLVGGCIVDKDKENRKAKMRETLLQIANISVPIIFVVYAAKAGKYFGKNFLEKGPVETMRTKIPKAIGGIAGLFAGVYTANIIGNKINEKIFNRGKGRPVQASDFSAHLDDFCVAAQQISTHPIVHGISRFVPVALMVAGNEVGNTCTANVDQ